MPCLRRLGRSRRDPWSLPSVEDVSGLAGLLREARAWHKEDGHGT